MIDFHNLVESEMKIFHDAVVARYKGTKSWIDAIVDECTHRGIELEESSGMVCPSLVSKLEEEAESKKMLKQKKVARL